MYLDKAPFMYVSSILTDKKHGKYKRNSSIFSITQGNKEQHPPNQLKWRNVSNQKIRVSIEKKHILDI